MRLTEDTITLDPTLGQLVIDSNVRIEGNGATIDAGQANRVLYAAKGVFASINGLIISGGQTEGPGGGIYNAGTLTLHNLTLSNNNAGQGGGIWNHGTLTLTASTISDNTASGSGGGICNRVR